MHSCHRHIPPPIAHPATCTHPHIPHAPPNTHTPHPQLAHCAVTLSTKEKRRCAVLSLPDVHIAEVQALYALPGTHHQQQEPIWWIEYCSLYRVDQVKQLHEEQARQGQGEERQGGERQGEVSSQAHEIHIKQEPHAHVVNARRTLVLPPDVDQANELIRGTCRKHARVDMIQGEVMVRKSKAGMGALKLRGASGGGGLFYRLGYDETTGQLVTDRPVSDFAAL